MKLQNTVMQLRKVCSHPFLFDWPLDPVTREPVVNEQLINASGKMMVLDRLLGELFKRGHKVLLFSQFTTMLDVIEVITPCWPLFPHRCALPRYPPTGMGLFVQVMVDLSYRWVDGAAGAKSRDEQVSRGG